MVSSFDEFRAIFCFPDPAPPAAPAKQYGPQYYLVQQQSQPTKGDYLMVDGTYLERRHIVMIEAMNDEIMPNQATEALARSFGLHILVPFLQAPTGMQQIASPGSGNVNNQTAILVQYEPATHGYNWSAEHGDMEYMPGYPFVGDVPYPKLPTKITIKEPIYETMAQVQEILDTYFSGANPVVRSTLAPVADFDGDGRPDGSDSDPYDPTK